FPLDGAGQRGGDVEVERVAELVGFRRSAGLDAGGLIARIMAAEAGFAQRTHQIAQRAEPKEVNSLAGDFEACRRLRFADLSAGGGRARRVVWLVNANVVFLLHPLNELL